MHWKPGDIALCIRSGKKTRSGRTYVVADAHPKGTPSPHYPSAILGCDALSFLDLPPTWNCRAERFIKIDPENLIDVELQKEVTHK